MRKSSPWLRFLVLLSVGLLLFGFLWLFQSAETPPWRNDAPKLSKQETPPTLPQKKAPVLNEEFTPFQFVSYNLKNWLSSSQNPDKSEKSKDAIIHILTTSDADVIGLSEIGSETDVAEVQRLLKQAGMDLPYAYHCGGIDPIRHLALLSRFPIISEDHPDIRIPGTDDSMQRGILDATVQIGNQPVRFIGLHLKSKRIVPTFDQAQLRIHEAQRVRSHIDEILTQSPQSSLIVYGDFNDHIRSLSTRTILGTYRSPLYMTPVSIKDQRGEKWTHYYESQDTYSRIDFITVSKSLKRHIDRKNTRIIDDPNWNVASDHRAVLTSFR